MELPSRLHGDHLLIAVGVVLLCNPLYVGALDLDEPNWYRYEAAEVEFTDDGIEGTVVGDVDGDVACLDRRYRICQLEHHVHDANVSYPDRMAAGPGPGYRYAYLDGEFYRVQPQSLGGDGELSHEHLPREEALAHVSTPLADASSAVREAVTSGSVETHRPLDGANELVAHDGRHYVVRRTGAEVFNGDAYDRKRTEGRVIEGGLTVLGIVVGLALVLRGQRRRLRRTWSRRR